MHFKRFKSLPKAQKSNEVYYMLGLDIGNDSSSIAFFNVSENAPEVIDISGGYGRPSIPTVMQYIPETNEWVFGEYAVLNHSAGHEVTVSSIVERLGRHEYVDVDGKPVSVANLLGLFIRELVGNVKNINPKAIIVGIVASVPIYINDEARAELTQAFLHAGYERELIALIPDRTCVFSRYYLSQKPREEHGLLIDFGSREVRGGLYHILPHGGGIDIRSMSSLFDDGIGTYSINSQIHGFISDYYADGTQTLPKNFSENTREQLGSFVFQHKDMLFQKNIRAKPIKLYFNFAYPPFQQTVTHLEVERLIRPYNDRFSQFIHDVIAKNLYGHEEVSPGDVDFVLCVGGGFEMLWAKEAVARIFPSDKIKFSGNAKVTAALGAAVVAALMLDAADGYNIVLEDKNQLDEDIGFLVPQNGRERFIPLVERNAFWWQRHPAKRIILNEPCDGSFTLDISARNALGEIRPLRSATIDKLPKRPKGTTRLNVQLSFDSDTDIIATVTDCGFGELFPRTDYKRIININR